MCVCVCGCVCARARAFVYLLDEKLLLCALDELYEIVSLHPCLHVSMMRDARLAVCKLTAQAHGTQQGFNDKHADKHTPERSHVRDAAPPPALPSPI